MKSVLIVGGGITGLTLLHKFASNGYYVKLYEKKHFGGTCYDSVSKSGIIIPKYGMHILHTNSERVFNYLSRFSAIRNYNHKAYSLVRNKLIPFPINNKNLIKYFGNDYNLYFNTMIKPYSKKQWGNDSEELMPMILNRINIFEDDYDGYFKDKWQFYPSRGWSELFKNMVVISCLNSNKLPEFALNNITPKEFIKDKSEIKIWTGKIDEFFGYKYGKLQYRSIKFLYKYYKTKKKVFPRAQINCPKKEIKFTRFYEPLWWSGQNGKIKESVVIGEIPCKHTKNNEPLYPVPTKRNMEIYAKYAKDAEKLKKKGIYFAGRLGKYQYINMDQAVEQAIDLVDEIIK